MNMSSTLRELHTNFASSFIRSAFNRLDHNNKKKKLKEIRKLLILFDLTFLSSFLQ